jgi:hypothetical protein
MVSTKRCVSPATSWWDLGVFPRYSGVGRWRDEFHTRVCSDMCVWVPTATSHRAWRLRLTLPDARSGWRLSVTESPGHAEAQVPLPGHGVRRIGDEIPSGRANRKVEEWQCGLSSRLVLFRLGGPPLQLVEVGLFSGTGYMVPQLYATGGNWSYPEI